MAEMYSGIQCYSVGGMGKQKRIVTFSTFLDLYGTCLGKIKKDTFQKQCFVKMILQ